MRRREMKCRIQRGLVQLPHIQMDPDVLSVAASHSLNMNNESSLAESADKLPSMCSADQKYSSAAANALQADVDVALRKLELDLPQMIECLTGFLVYIPQMYQLHL